MALLVRGLAVWLVLASAVTACNAVVGAHDRSLVEPGSGPIEKRPVGERDGGGVLEPVDGSPLTEGGVPPADAAIVQMFTSPNGATTTTVPNGTVITGFGFEHGVIVPSPPPTFPGEDYTLIATIISPPGGGEFGVVTRIQGDGSSVVFGSELGNTYVPFLGTMGPPNWNPGSTFAQDGGVYTPVLGARYKMVVQARGSKISAKMWREGAQEPGAFQAEHDYPTFATGKGIGFYTRGNVGAILVSLIVVP